MKLFWAEPLFIYITPLLLLLYYFRSRYTRTRNLIGMIMMFIIILCLARPYIIRQPPHPRSRPLYTQTTRTTRPEPLVVEDIYTNKNNYKLGQTVTTDIRLYSSIDKAFLELSVNNKAIKTIHIKKHQRPQTFRISLKLTSHGPNELTASAYAINQNNKRLLSTKTKIVNVENQYRILILTQHAENVIPLKALFNTSLYHINIVEPLDFDSALKRLNQYDTLILYDLPPILNLYQEKLISRYIRKTGGGLIFVGGASGFNWNASNESPLGKLLPVTSKLPKPERLHSISLGVIVDTSGSMAGQSVDASKINLLQIASNAAIATLKPDTDEFGLLAFSNAPSWIKYWSKPCDSIDLRFNAGKLLASGKSNLQSALAVMNDSIQNRTADIRHVLIFSDGFVEEPFTQYFEQVRAMSEKHITVSTVSLGHDSNKILLQQLANIGKGRFYQVSSISDIPQVVTQDRRRLLNSGLVEKTALPIIKSSSFLTETLFSNTNPEIIPPLLGYLRTALKKDSQSILTIGNNIPLLAWAPRGLGRVFYFGSDAHYRWARLWIKHWGGFRNFWTNLIQLASREHNHYFKIKYLQTPTTKGLVISTSPTPSFENNTREMNISFENQNLSHQKLIAQPTGLNTYWVKLPRKLSTDEFGVNLKLGEHTEKHYINKTTKTDALPENSLSNQSPVSSTDHRKTYQDLIILIIGLLFIYSYQSNKGER